MRQEAIVLLLILLLCPLASAQEPWCGLNTVYFQRSTSPDLPGYEELRNYPSGAPETEINVTITQSDGLVHIADFITPPGEPGTYAYESGLRQYRTYHFVDKGIGDTRFIFRPFIYHTDGTTTPLYEVMTGEIDALTITEYLYTYAIANRTETLATDRIGISVYVNTTSAAEVYAHFVYEGNMHHSHIDAGYYSCEPPYVPTIPNLPAPPITDPGIPWYIWVLGVLVLLLSVRVIL